MGYVEKSFRLLPDSRAYGDSELYLFTLPWNQEKDFRTSGFILKIEMKCGPVTMYTNRKQKTCPVLPKYFLDSE